MDRSGNDPTLRHLGTVCVYDLGIDGNFANPKFQRGIDGYALGVFCWTILPSSDSRLSHFLDPGYSIFRVGNLEYHPHRLAIISSHIRLFDNQNSMEKRKSRQITRRADMENELKFLSGTLTLRPLKAIGSQPSQGSAYRHLCSRMNSHELEFSQSPNNERSNAIRLLERTSRSFIAISVSFSSSSNTKDNRVRIPSKVC